jgi:XTP/dITP diphosphohydrolase
MNLLFATNNSNKVLEIQDQLRNTAFKIISLAEAGISEEIPEPFATIEENSHHKAQVIFEKYKLNCFAEDTGLIVPSLSGEPGVMSARYAGANATDKKNIDKLLLNLETHQDRSAYFKTVITLVINGAYYQFNGKCEGSITKNILGNEGFGYDPIFIPLDDHRTFAQMGIKEKKEFSHRAKAMNELIKFLSNLS